MESIRQLYSQLQDLRNTPCAGNETERGLFDALLWLVARCVYAASTIEDAAQAAAEFSRAVERCTTVPPYLRDAAFNNAQCAARTESLRVYDRNKAVADAKQAAESVEFTFG